MTETKAITAHMIFNIPSEWFFFYGFLALCVGGYLHKENRGIGQLSLLRSQSRYCWWFGKCFGVMQGVIGYFLITYGITVIFSLFTGHLDSKMMSDVYYEQSGIIIGNFWSPNVIFLMIVYPVIISLSICLMQLLCSLIWNEIGAVGLIFAILVISSYFSKGIYIGNYLMIYRLSIFMGNGVNWKTGIVYALTIIIVAIVGGGYYFGKKDILQSKGRSI